MLNIRRLLKDLLRLLKRLWVLLKIIKFLKNVYINSLIKNNYMKTNDRNSCQKFHFIFFFCEFFSKKIL